MSAKTICGRCGDVFDRSARYWILDDVEFCSSSCAFDSTPSGFDLATERHFQTWLDSFAGETSPYNDHRDTVERLVRGLVAVDPERLERESWPEIYRAAKTIADRG